VKLVFFTLRGLKVEEGEFRVKFDKVCKWFDGCDRLEIVFKSRKNIITKLSFILNIIRYCHYIRLIFVEKILICINENNIFH